MYTVYNINIVENDGTHNGATIERDQRCDWGANVCCLRCVIKFFI